MKYKLIKKEEYNRLKENDHKYKLLIGQEFTIYIGGRTLRRRLLNLEKEELIKYIFDMNSTIGDLKNRIKKYEKVLPLEYR